MEIKECSETLIEWSQNTEEHWKIRFLKEMAHILVYVDLFSRSILDINTKVIKKEKTSCASN